MPKAKRIKEEKKIDNEQKSMEEEIIDHFIWRKDSDATDDYKYSFPVMMRLDRDHTARLDHLAKIWRIKRSSLARQMLEEMIHLVMARYYRDKKPEEYLMIQREAWDEFDKKMIAGKKKKGK